MADREDLRKYFRQLAEAGETELTLPSLTEAEARSALSSQKIRRPAAARAAQIAPSADWRSAIKGESVENTVVTDIFAAPSALASLDDIATAVAACTRCVLHQAAKNPVPGEGNPNAELVCVGEGPGASEDETGRPFVGAAGKLLSDILAAIKLAREEVYICNVVKHRPPGNRTPFPDEIIACNVFLARQLELVKPRVILALGATAAQTLLSTKLALGKLRGTIHRYNGVPLIVTYHPAALLRNPAWKRPTWEDVQIVRRILDSAAGS